MKRINGAGVYHGWINYTATLREMCRPPTAELNRFAVHGRVEVEVCAEAIAVFVDHRGNGRELDIPLVFANQPVNQVILSIHAQIQPADGEIGQGALAAGGK